uniref:NADH-ubiquinone oxidoreductase chain 4L n=1 Tax=Cucujoidea sp. 44 KM-2017 TaxID=2219383 RepID=A0A346RHH0_9CUCU|nr:NADH dehydrogenase subunit 4L [Cucujoidea sp. 44 KM-2017]
MLIFLLISVFMFYSGLMVYCLKRKHLLSMLMSLEFMVLSLFVLLNCYLGLMMYEFYLLMLFLIITVCEGVLGLSLLVFMIRSYGNDYVMMFSLLW